MAHFLFLSLSSSLFCMSFVGSLVGERSFKDGPKSSQVEVKKKERTEEKAFLSTYLSIFLFFAQPM